MVQCLSRDRISEVLSKHSEWSYDNERQAFFRALRLSTFSETFALMTRIAMAAEKADHHPEWSNVYNRLDIWLTTHDAAGVSERDVAMIRVIDEMISQN